MSESNRWFLVFAILVCVVFGVMGGFIWAICTAAGFALFISLATMDVPDDV